MGYLTEAEVLLLASFALDIDRPDFRGKKIHVNERGAARGLLAKQLLLQTFVDGSVATYYVTMAGRAVLRERGYDVKASEGWMPPALTRFEREEIV